MKSDTVLDYAIFEFSQKHSRCELVVSGNGETEKLSSGSIELFVNHLSILATQSLFRAEVERNDNNGKSWFTKRTLERFVQFVNGPEVLERVNTFDSEMSQLEAARTLYSRDDGGVPDATKKELLRAIDLRLEAIKEDLTTSIAHASSNGFDPQTVSHLQRFADTFGAHSLGETCGKYMSLCERRPDLITTLVNETNISQLESSQEDEEEKKESSTVKTSQDIRRLSVQDRINLFESKKMENSNSAGHKPVVVAKSTELRRLSSDVPSAAPLVPEKSVLRRWSVVSGTSFDVSGKDEGPSSRPSSGNPDAILPRDSEVNSKSSDDYVCSTKHDDTQNQSDGDDSRQREEESYASKPHSVAQQQSFGVEDDLVNADSAGKIISNRVSATSVDQTQRARMSRDSSQGDKKENKNVVMRRNVSELSYSDDSKGKLYEMYMKKRDAKLREERSSKETKLKSMQEALERSRTEMKAKFSAASEKRHDSVSSTRQRAEKFRSFNSRSSMKKFQHPISSLQSKEEDLQDKPSIGSQVRKAPSPNRSSRVSKPSGKVSNTNITSGRGRRTTEISQSSVPNFSDLKKENTKPSSLAVRKAPMMRTQVRSSSSNKKTTKEEIPSPVKARRPRSQRKSFSSNIEFTELTTLYSDDVVNKEMNQKQGCGIDDVPEKLKDDEFDEMAEEEDKQVVEDPVKEEEEAREMDIHVIDEKTSLENSSDDENVTSQIGLLPSTFQHNVESLMDSPSESSLSWNSNLQHAFSYPQEHSDADDSPPMGSPGSWSSRMRKKWGTTATAAQSHVTVSNSSPLHSRKDLAKGIKRLLKFGKKTRPADSLMDWVSVTTSEGDDDEQGSFKAKDGDFKRSFFSLSTFRSKGNDSKPR